jgi:hypothetical protein
MGLDMKSVGRIVRKIIDLGVGDFQDVDLHVTVRSAHQRAGRSASCGSG